MKKIIIYATIIVMALAIGCTEQDDYWSSPSTKKKEVKEEIYDQRITVVFMDTTMVFHCKSSHLGNYEIRMDQVKELNNKQIWMPLDNIRYYYREDTELIIKY